MPQKGWNVPTNRSKGNHNHNLEKVQEMNSLKICSEMRTRKVLTTWYGDSESPNPDPEFLTGRTALNYEV